MMRRPKGIDWEPRTAVRVAKDGVLPLLRLGPLTRGRPPLLTAPQRLGSCSTTIQPLLSRSHQRVSSFDASPSMVKLCCGLQFLSEKQERERDKERTGRRESGWKRKREAEGGERRGKRHQSSTVGESGHDLQWKLGLRGKGNRERKKDPQEPHGCQGLGASQVFKSQILTLKFLDL